MSDVLVRVICQLHHEVMGRVWMHNGHPRYWATNPGIFARKRRLVGFADGSTTSAYVDEFSGEVEGWCPKCGLEGRWVAASILMAAVQGDRSKVVLI
jgi:hypothetical protein